MSPRLLPRRTAASTAQRSDRPVRTDVGQVVAGRLEASPYRALRRIASDFHEGVVTLRGQVRSFHMKQMAQEEAAHVPGVEAIVNRLEVSHQEATESEARRTPRPGARQR
jgi:osmotically-inducible protein OsmY